MKVSNTFLMRKRCTLLMIVFLCVTFLGKLSAQTYQVQIAAFTEDIDHSFFAYAGYKNVYTELDHNNFTRYTLGEYFTLEAAENVRKNAISRGFLNTHIITLDQPQYAYSGDSHELPLIMVPEKEALYIRSVQFSANDLSFNTSLLNSLEEALSILKKHQNLKLQIVGHTDNIGKQEENQTISKTRARMIQNFLLANEIPAYRLKMKVSNESSPEVYFKGKGLPQTRDFNRRIIMTLVDLKEEVVVDNFQKNHNLNIDKSLSEVSDVAKIMKFIKLA